MHQQFANSVGHAHAILGAACQTVGEQRDQFVAEIGKHFDNFFGFCSRFIIIKQSIVRFVFIPVSFGFLLGQVDDFFKPRQK